MIDKILYINDKEAILYFSNKKPLNLYHSDGNIIVFVNWFLADTKLNICEFELISEQENEVTQPNIVLKTA